jgi:hypothetical protein
VKRSDRDEPMWVAIHKCMEATLGNSLYSYLYLELAKNAMPFLCLMSYVLRFLFTKSEDKREEQILSEVGGMCWGEVAQTMYTHASKCKKGEIKDRKKKNPETPQPSVATPHSFI